MKHPALPSFVCRSHNRFAPSIALWQYYVLPNQRNGFQPRWSSTSTAAVVDTPTTPGSSVDDVFPSIVTDDPIQPLEDSTRESGNANQEESRTVKNVVKTRKGKSELRLRPAEEARNKQSNYVERLPKNGKGKAVKYTKIDQHDHAFSKKVPWHTHPSDRVDAMERLTIEMVRFSRYARPNGVESFARKRLIRMMRTHVKKAIPNADIEVFGSEQTGLALALSDIDILLKIEGLRGHNEDGTISRTAKAREEMNGHLKVLRRHLRESHQYDPCNIYWSRFPLLDTTHITTGLNIQLVIGNINRPSEDLIRSYLTEFPYLHELWPIIKTTFEFRDMMDVRKGGITSYPLFMMTVAALRHTPPETPTAGAALLQFLKFWGRFDTAKHGLSIDPPEYFDKSQVLPLSEVNSATIENQGFNPTHLLCLRDPADPTNDLGRRATLIKHFQATCQGLYVSMRRRLETNGDDSLTSPLVGAVHVLNADRRARLLSAGYWANGHLKAAGGAAGGDDSGEKLSFRKISVD
ncbi:hypothetical protein BU24DRAFT_453623 [Aaosphaeria arxii CBS 175.79]|uniref:polynucleotide adenylyltransferase n=1 Tax=Aaosphaeria arxii CBS 175.79 TaxID=1450172 RepID=A0A6A5XIN7_9PLEO|nr:uncharacterized protein BU24DRAFT_453623 [Aaosphaeria arxii CBS 175.79]KAF2012174.1 hypothetical protein BU24DRAFT_453623 [Aaosphaeria arxii CBS 175.79]